MELLRELALAVTRDMTVIVLCDRGISSPKRIRARAGIPVWATERISTSAPRRPSAVAPCRRSGMPGRRNSGSSCRLVSRHWSALQVATPLALGYGTGACPVLDTGVEDAQGRRIDPGNLGTPTRALSAQHHGSWQKPKRKVGIIRHGIGWLRLLLRGPRWDLVWLLPEHWPQPKAACPCVATPYIHSCQPPAPPPVARHMGHGNFPLGGYSQLRRPVPRICSPPCAWPDGAAEGSCTAMPG